MRPFHNARILLGVTGGIACYKSVWLARLLTQAGAQVDVVMTAGAREFLAPITFEAVTGRPVHTNIFAHGQALDHIRLARSASAIIVAPATADFIARAAHGQADDLLSTILLAASCPVMIAPAMNDRMWAHAQTQANVAHLRSLGYVVVDPDRGPLAVGEGEGPGRLPEPDVLRDHLARLVEPDQSLQGKRVLVTSGATREAIDPVRFISNYSTGKMGAAIAAEAWRRGAHVTMIMGHVETPAPTGVVVRRVSTTLEMADAVREELPDSDVLVMAAAPADYRAAESERRKLKKDGTSRTLTLTETPDILKSTIADRAVGAVIVGFALETHDAVDYARGKLQEKQLDLVVANQAGIAGEGFGADTNRVTLIDRNGETEALPLLSKAEVAECIWDRVQELLSGR
jgi:phosphopantothenoylcysteine decarboxylase/phosphopantothenate--cysteine ligase